MKKKKLTEGHKTASDHLIECLNDHFVINFNWVTLESYDVKIFIFLTGRYSQCQKYVMDTM